jgi:integrase
MRQLTDLKVKSLKPQGRPYDTRDSQIPGLAVRTMPSGVRTFVLITRRPGKSHPTRLSIGRYPDLSLQQAREKAAEWRKSIRQGKDPQIQEQRDRLATIREQQLTFAVVAEAFISEKLSTERKGAECTQDIKRELIPQWGNRPIGDITPLDVSTLVKAIKQRGHLYQAHNVLVLIRRLFNWCVGQPEYPLTASPCDRLKPKEIIGTRAPRKRVLDKAELRACWLASEKMEYPYKQIYQLLILTGLRRSEVGSARWSEFDLEGRLWTIPAERMKSGATHCVPLCDDALAILKELPRFNHGDYLFSTTFGKKPVRGFNRAKLELDKYMQEIIGAAFPAFVVHDVRRSMRTNLSALPVPSLVCELCVGHVQKGMHKVYDQYSYLNEKRHALELWAQKLRTIISPPSSNVVSLAS